MVFGSFYQPPTTPSGLTLCFGKLIFNSILMKEKERYSSPESEVMEVQPQGVVCISPAVSLTMADPFANNQDEIPW